MSSTLEDYRMVPPLVAAILAPVLLAAVVIGMVYAPEAVAQGQPWLDLGITPHTCPGCFLCGLSRAFSLAGHGQGAAAVRSNGLVTLAWPLFWVGGVAGPLPLLHLLHARKAKNPCTSPPPSCSSSPFSWSPSASSPASAR